MPRKLTSWYRVKMEGLFLGDQHGLTVQKAKISYYNENEKGTINLKYPIKIKKGMRLPLWRAPRV
jgi:uncharacterized protein YhjY with autotransporter beta-barrel domain